MISFCFPWTELLKESQSSCSGASSRQRDWDHKMASSRLKCVLLALTTLTQTKCDEYSRYSLITLSLAEFVLRGFWCHFVIQTEYEKQRHSNWFHLLLLFLCVCVCMCVNTHLCFKNVWLWMIHLLLGWKVVFAHLSLLPLCLNKVPFVGIPARTVEEEYI